MALISRMHISRCVVIAVLVMETKFVMHIGQLLTYFLSVRLHLAKVRSAVMNFADFDMRSCELA